MKTAATHTNLVSVSYALLFLQAREMLASKTVVRLLLISATVTVLTYLATRYGGAFAYWDRVIDKLFGLFLPFLCLTKGGEAVRSELKEGTMEYLWTRPVRRSHLFVGLFAASFASVAATVFAAILPIVAIGMWIGVWESAMMLVSFLATAVACVFGYAAISALLGAFSARYVVWGLLYFATIELGLGSVATGVRNVSISAHVEDLLDPIRYGADGGYFLQFAASTLWILGIGGVALALGAGLFATTRYFVGSSKEGE